MYTKAEVDAKLGTSQGTETYYLDAREIVTNGGFNYTTIYNKAKMMTVCKDVHDGKIYKVSSTLVLYLGKINPREQTVEISVYNGHAKFDLIESGMTNPLGNKIAESTFGRMLYDTDTDEGFIVTVLNFN